MCSKDHFLAMSITLKYVSKTALAVVVNIRERTLRNNILILIFTKADK